LDVSAIARLANHRILLVASPLPRVAVIVVLASAFPNALVISLYVLAAVAILWTEINAN
jgi:hypothetical protein